MPVQIVVIGIRRIDRKLRKLPPIVQRKVARQAIRAGLKTLVPAIKAEAPVDTGTLRSKVKVRAVPRRKRGKIELEVRILADDDTKKTSAKTGQTVFYPAIVHYGRKGVPPNPFMRRVYDAKGESTKKLIIAHLKAGIDRAIKAP